MTHPSREDRIAGCLLAGALGDAIGSHFEGRAPNSDFVVPSELRVSDDTQLTMATCESIIESGEVDPESVADHFLRWYRERRFSGIGASTLKALRELEVGGHWALVGAVGDRSAGNGAAMRISPLAFFLDPDVKAERQTIRDVCRITHQNDEAYVGALALLRSIRRVMAGGPLDESLLPLLVDVLPDSRVRDRLIIVRDDSLSVEAYAARFAATGYVVDSVPLALVAAMQSVDLLGTIRQVVQCGGDTDTIASMAAQLVGAARGTQALPKEIVQKISAAEQVRTVAASLAQVSITK